MNPKKLLILLAFTSIALCLLPNATIKVKTNHLTTHPHTLQDFKNQLAGPPKSGYCEKSRSNLYYISNRYWCGGSTNNLIIFYVNVTFAVGVSAANYSFDLPSNFGLGGYSMMDGEAKVVEKANIQSSRELNFWQTLHRGVHTLEVYGAENCCDQATRWTFLVDNITYSFNVHNLNSFNIECPG